MKVVNYRFVCGSLAFFALIVSTRAANTAPAAPDVPREIAVPSSYKVVARLAGKGAQLYEAIESRLGLQWKPIGPVANLSDESGKRVGYHYQGPTWESIDGSAVVHESRTTIRSVPAPNKKEDAPWLLIKVKSMDSLPSVLGGSFDAVEYIQRIDTSGGNPPVERPKRNGTKIGVHYTATYVFWAKK